MSLTAAAIRLLAAKGLTVDDIALIAEANEAENTVTAGALRTRRWREKRHQASPSVTETKPEAVTESVTERHQPSPLPAHVRDITSNSENNHNHTLLETRRDPESDWPEGKAHHHAELICAEMASPWLDMHKSPDLVTTTGLIASWKRDGASWEHDVLPLIRGRLMNRRKPVTTWKFFNDAIGETIAANREALKIPEAGTVIPFRQVGPPLSRDEKISSAWDFAEQRIAADE